MSQMIRPWSIRCSP